MKLSLTEKTAAGLHVFCGVGALLGGTWGMSDPDNPMGIPAAEALVNSPFKDFFIPGLILFTVLGLGNIFAALMFLRYNKTRGWVSGFFASAMVIWILVQCVMLQSVHALHVIFFIIGAAQGLIALRTLFLTAK